MGVPRASTTLALSPNQVALWFLARLVPENHAYNLHFGIRVRAPLDLAAARAAFQVVVDRHDALRSTIDDAGAEPRFRVAPEAAVAFEHVDATAWSDAELDARLLAAGRAPFDLVRGPLFRAKIFTRGPDEHVLSFNLHHIVADYGAMAIVSSEWFRAYAGVALPPAAPGFSEFLAWQEGWLAGPEADAALARWVNRLSPLPPPLELPADRARPPVTRLVGATHRFTLPPAEVAALRALAKAHKTTLTRTLLAGLHLLFARHGGVDDVVVGVTSAGRRGDTFRASVGYFANSVPIRVKLDGDPTVGELLARVDRATAEGLADGDTPFPRVLAALREGPGRPPLLQCVLTSFRAGDGGPEDLTALMLGRVGTPDTKGGLPVEAIDVAHQEGQFPLLLAAYEVGGELQGTVRYDTELFDAATVARLFARYATLLAGMAARAEARVSTVPILPDDERAQLDAWNATAHEVPETTIAALFQAAVDRAPEALAVVAADGRRWTYRELERAANRVAWGLRARGVARGDVVGVKVERGPEMVIAFLGILVAGAVYAPLDPAAPPARLEGQLADAGVRLVLDAVDGEGRDDRPPAITGPDDLAYLLFTSGSTGRPKGALVHQRAIVNRVLWAAATYGMRADDVFLQKTAYTFDVSVAETLVPLISGASLAILAPDAHRDGAQVVAAIQATGATSVHYVPSLLRPFLAEPALTACKTLKRVIASGEPLPREAQERCAALGVTLFNHYGPTECAVDVTSATAVAGASSEIPIGAPVWNVQTHVLDARLERVPVGVVGELYLGGVAVGRGYHGQPAMTAERYLPDPFGVPGARVYRTGDLVRRGTDGALTYLGRADQQVKVRGVRIELGEIEAAVASHPAVRQAVACAREDRPGDKRLVAYATVAPGATLDVAELREHVTARLPAAMIPSAFVVLDVIPLTSSGKADRRALPAPSEERALPAQSYVAPTSAPERVLAEVWATVLRVDRVGVNDGFFQLGGDSILALQAVGRAAAAGITATVSDLFRHQTIAKLLAALPAAAGAAVAVSTPTTTPEGEPFPLSAGQEAMWGGLQLTGDDGQASGSGFQLATTETLDVDALRTAWDKLIQRHACLRSTFGTGAGGAPFQRVDPAARVPLEILPADLPEAAIRARFDALVRAPYDLERGPIVRALFAPTPGDQRLAIAGHHLAADGWSRLVMVDDLWALYAAAKGAPAPAPPGAPYAAFVAREAAMLRGAEGEAHLKFWQRELDKHKLVLDLPIDLARPKVLGTRGAGHEIDLGPTLTRGLLELARAEQLTLFTLLLAPYQALLGAWAKTADVIVGAPVAIRRPEHVRTVGLMLNVVPFRLRLSPTHTLRDLLRFAQKTVTGALDHREYPTSVLIQKLKLPRDLSRPRLVQALMHLQRARLADDTATGVTQSTLEAGSIFHELELSVVQDGDRLAVRLLYNVELFRPETIARLARAYHGLLARVVAQPTDRATEAATSLLATEGLR